MADTSSRQNTALYGLLGFFVVAALALAIALPLTLSKSGRGCGWGRNTQNGPKSTQRGPNNAEDIENAINASNAAAANAAAEAQAAANAAAEAEAQANARFDQMVQQEAAARAQANSGRVAPEPMEPVLNSGVDAISDLGTPHPPYAGASHPDLPDRPVDPSGNSVVNASQLLPSPWRSNSGDAMAADTQGKCISPQNWASFAPTKAGFDRFIHASRHATMGINSRQPNPVRGPGGGGIRMDILRPPPAVALSGETVPFGDSSYRQDALNIAAQNLINTSALTGMIENRCT